MPRQGMELWRPDWPKIYKVSSRHSLPDVDGEILTVTRETLRLSLSALNSVMEQDYHDNYGAAARELHHVLGIAKD